MQDFLKQTFRRAIKKFSFIEIYIIYILNNTFRRNTFHRSGFSCAWTTLDYKTKSSEESHFSFQRDVIANDFPHSFVVFARKQSRTLSPGKSSVGVCVVVGIV